MQELTVKITVIIGHNRMRSLSAAAQQHQVTDLSFIRDAAGYWCEARHGVWYWSPPTRRKRNGIASGRIAVTIWQWGQNQLLRQYAANYGSVAELIRRAIDARLIALGLVSKTVASEPEIN